MPNSLDVTAFVSESPDFLIIDGLVHIRQQYSDRMCIERVMRLHVFLKTIAMAQKAVREYHERGTAEVIPFRKRRAH